MPLRDHFRPPVSKQVSWEGFHATWPVMLMLRLNAVLPTGFSAEPRARLGRHYEIDIGTFEGDGAYPARPDSGGGVATLPRAVADPTLSVELDIAAQYEYAVLVFDDTRDRTLVAAVEFVSPANKDRADHRRAFVAKCSTLLQAGVSVAVIDTVSNRRFNLYADILAHLGVADPTVGAEPPATYAASCRTVAGRDRSRLDGWAYPLAVGSPLPAVPLWLTEDTAIDVDFEGSYEDACRALGVG